MATLTEPAAALGSRPAWDGFRDGAAVMAAYVPFAIALGAALTATSVQPFVAWSSSALMFGGAAQLLAVQLLGSGATAPAVVLAALVVNARHLLYSASLARHTRPWSRRSRALAAYFMADPVYALSIARFEGRDDGGPGRRVYYFAVALTCWGGWLSLTAAGVLLAGTLPEALPLEHAAPLTFLLLTLPMLKGRPRYAAAAVAGAVAVLTASLPLGVGLVLAAAAGVATGAAASAAEGGEKDA